MAEATVVFTHTFGASVTVGGEEAPTPTDYFRYQVSIAHTEEDGSRRLKQLDGDHAFMMENQWLVRLPKVFEATLGAAPHTLVAYYCDMFPFQGIESDIRTRLPRQDVPQFVRAELLPKMVDAFRVQTEEWGLWWHEEWTSFRRSEDAGQLSVALTDGRTWYHGEAPSGGYAGISLNTNADDTRAPFDTLVDDLMSAFYHELFHNLQRSLCQHLGGDGRVGGADDAWVFFSEGTAYLASSVGLPGAHFGATNRPRRDPGSDVSSQGIATLPVMYWRFLYEQCGGLAGDFEDPGAGMAIVRRALTLLYEGSIVDIAESRDLFRSIPRVLDAAIAATPLCPFRTYEQSLVHFARALHGLHLDGGRCTEPGEPAGCGFYDPHSLYSTPAIMELRYGGGQEDVGAHSWTSLDIDLYEVALQPGPSVQPLELVLEPDARGDAVFVMQVWKLVEGRSGPRPIPDQAEGPEMVGTAGPGERLVYSIGAIDLTEFDRIGLLVTRAEPYGRSDSPGQYTIRLQPAS
jgi:hypothetical protein